MKKAFVTLLALVFTTLTASAWFTGGGELQGFHVGSDLPASITMTATDASPSDLTTYSFAGLATGAAGANRKTIAGVHCHDTATAFTITGVTMDNGGGATAMTLVVDTAAETGSTEQSAIYIINNTSGTTATFAVTNSEAVSSCLIAVWDARDLLSSTAVGTSSNFQTISAALTLSINTTAGGVAVGISGVGTRPETTTWTGLTENGAEIDAGAGGAAMSPADLTVAVSSTPLSITSDWSNTGDATGAAASFR